MKRFLHLWDVEYCAIICNVTSAINHGQVLFCLVVSTFSASPQRTFHTERDRDRDTSKDKLAKLPNTIGVLLQYEHIHTILHKSV